MTGSSVPLRLDNKSDLIDRIDSVGLLAAGVQRPYDRLGAKRQEKVFYRLAGADLLRLAADD